MGIAESKTKLRNKIRIMPKNYIDAMGLFFGTSVAGSIPVANYKAKVKPGMEDKWETNLKNSFGL